MNTIEIYCDSCNQRAAMRVVLSSGLDLLFCGHHMNKHKESLPANARVEPLETVETPVPVG